MSFGKREEIGIRRRRRRRHIARAAVDIPAQILAGATLLIECR